MELDVSLAFSLLLILMIRIHELKRNNEEFYIIPSEFAYDVCSKLIRLQHGWFDFILGDLKNSAHGVASVFYSRKYHYICGYT